MTWHVIRVRSKDAQKQLARTSLSHLMAKSMNELAHKSPLISIGVGPMIWDNFSIFRTNCAIACGTRAYMLRGFFSDVAQGKWHPRFRHEIYDFGLQLNTFMSVGIWLKYFRRKLLQ